MIRKTPLSVQTTAASKRRGVVLLMVLVVVVLLTLAAFQYSDLMTAEYQAADNYHKLTQAKAFADSGLHYAAAVLSTPDNIENTLNGNPYDNAEAFKGKMVAAEETRKLPGMFTLIAPATADGATGESAVRFGVTDESGKININSMMKSDATGQKLHDMLVKLPNMTTEIAGSIVDWVDADSKPFGEGGAESDYYSGLKPSYRAKNGPLDSLDELLLVKGVTPELLYGTDRNRNGVEDPGEEGAEGFSRGWSAYLTIYSRESNRDANGVAYAYVNGDELDVLYDSLAAQAGDDIAKFIVLYRQYGPSTSSGQQQSLGRAIASLFMGGKGKSNSSNSSTRVGKLAEITPDLTKKPKQKLKSLFDLVNTQVTIKGKDSKEPSTIYYSPLNDEGMRRDLLPKLFQNATVYEETELPARINVNTAPKEVLAALPDLTEVDVENILGRRPLSPPPEAPGSIFETPAWLLIEANLRPETLRKLEKVVTTKTQVYRVQSLGYFEGGKGPVARVEGVIDVNGGRPRIIAYRDLSDLGRSKIP